MSLRELVEGHCGAANPLMKLGSQVTRDAAHRDEGLVQAQFERTMHQDEHMVNEFLGQVAGPPQSFHMETLLQEMREIEQAPMSSNQLQHAPSVIDEVAGQWYQEFRNTMHKHPPPLPAIVHVQPQQQQMTYAREFFEEPVNFPNKLSPYLPTYPPCSNIITNRELNTGLTNQFFEETTSLNTDDLPQKLQDEDWANEYQSTNVENEQAATSDNEKFWQRLQDEWLKVSDESDESWMSRLFNENCDEYKDYKFSEENPMKDIDNALEIGKEYLAKGDIPSAVLCFEVAVVKDPENAEAWELLGISQAENEMDPHAIAALEQCLKLNPQNLNVLMALSVCYTNEGLQSNALKVLTKWLKIHPKYTHLVPSDLDSGTNAGAARLTSLSSKNKLKEVQSMFLEAVRMDPKTIDSEVQEALGVLYNLSSEYDKAVDCFRAALYANPQNAKMLNRLGASLANGLRCVEAIEVYQNALELEPGYIRVRYNVGVCCLNMKAYRQSVEHLLTALTMQSKATVSNKIPSKGNQQMSESIWSTLRTVLTLMGRHDLQGYVRDRNLEALNAVFLD